MAEGFPSFRGRPRNLACSHCRLDPSADLRMTDVTPHSDTAHYQLPRMTPLEILLLAVVQGITEFLPISSDGHLAVVNALLASAGGKEVNTDLLETTIVLHLGTLASVLVFYRRDIVRVLTTARSAI